MTTGLSALKAGALLAWSAFQRSTSPRASSFSVVRSARSCSSDFPRAMSSARIASRSAMAVGASKRAPRATMRARYASLSSLTGEGLRSGALQRDALRGAEQVLHVEIDDEPTVQTHDALHVIACEPAEHLRRRREARLLEQRHLRHRMHDQPHP